MNSFYGRKVVRRKIACRHDEVLASRGGGMASKTFRKVWSGSFRGGDPGMARERSGSSMRVSAFSVRVAESAFVLLPHVIFPRAANSPRRRDPRPRESRDAKNGGNASREKTRLECLEKPARYSKRLYARRTKASSVGHARFPFTG